MTHINALRNILGKFLGWNKARLDCFAKMMVALLQVRTVNLREIAIAFESRAQIDSRYKRLKRFFGGFNFNQESLSEWIFKMFNFQEVYLTVDRTNWLWGKSPINLLVLSVAYEGMA